MAKSKTDSTISPTDRSHSDAKVKVKRKKAKKNATPPPADDPMSQCVLLCQQQRWRQALVLCRKICDGTDGDGKDDIRASLTAAQAKIEYSLRRQMAAALIKEAKNVLAKEYLLDVGE